MEGGHCIATVHAEENCILQAAAIAGMSTRGSTIYTTYAPCYHGFKKLAVGGVKKIVAAAIYRDPTITEACDQAGIEFVLYQPDQKWLTKLSKEFEQKIEEKLIPDKTIGD